jgi:hypothetical protein
VAASEPGEALSTLFDLAAAGLFPHAASPDGCKFCQVERVCGGPLSASEASAHKLAASQNPVLAAFRRLHGENQR